MAETIIPPMSVDLFPASEATVSVGPEISADAKKTDERVSIITLQPTSQTSKTTLQKLRFKPILTPEKELQMELAKKIRDRFAKPIPSPGRFSNFLLIHPTFKSEEDLGRQLFYETTPFSVFHKGFLKVGWTNYNLDNSSLVTRFYEYRDILRTFDNSQDRSNYINTLTNIERLRLFVLLRDSSLTTAETIALTEEAFQSSYEVETFNDHVNRLNDCHTSDERVAYLRDLEEKKQEEAIKLLRDSKLATQESRRLTESFLIEKKKKSIFILYS
ncbi:MAG: hypothetical protein L7U87_04935 [Chlamydiales bacterium]|nr:hypothetical protein [Chlamydiales bacterium]